MRRFLGRAAKSKFLWAVFALALVAFLADFYVGMKQENIIKEKEERKKRLEKLAFFMIFPDIDSSRDIGVEEYEAIIKVDNVADEPVYVTHPQVKAYVQTGTFWTEVPVEELGEERTEQIYKLQSKQYLYNYLVNIDRNIKYTHYLMPLYMHVRFHISLFVLPESAFEEEEVVERYTDVYIYLKPYFIKDEDILAELEFVDNIVPTFIPMPPH